MPVLGPGVPESERSASRSSARPAAAFPLLPGQPVAKRVNQIVMGELVIPVATFAARDRPSPLNALGVRRRDQPEIVVEDADQVLEVVLRSPRRHVASRSSASDRIRPLMSVPASGSRALRTTCAAFWCRRCSGGAVAALKVSSRNVRPTPSVPPDLPQGRRGPRLRLDHLGEQGQAYRDHLAVLSEPRRSTSPGTPDSPGRVAYRVSGKTP